MGEITSTVELAENRDGSSQLRRHWQTNDARAALQIVHGIGEHSGRYLHVGDFLANRGIDVAAFDNRGFGQSAGRRGHIDRFDIYLDDIADRLEERRQLGGPVGLLGHSLGGLMVASYAVSDRPQPDLVVLSAPALSAEVPRWQRVAAPIVGRIAPKVFVPSKIDGEILTKDKEVQQAYLNDPLGVAGATAGLGHEIFSAMEAVSGKISELRAPTYVIHGQADKLVPQSASRGLEALPNVTYRSWPNLRHECFNEPEHPEVLGELVTWIDEQLGS